MSPEFVRSEFAGSGRHTCDAILSTPRTTILKEVQGEAKAVFGTSSRKRLDDGRKQQARFIGLAFAQRGSAGLVRSRIAAIS
jgi:hypothetical protein